METAAGESRTVNSDWSDKHPGRFSPTEILLVLIVIVNQSFYETVNTKSVCLRYFTSGTLHGADTALKTALK